MKRMMRMILRMIKIVVIKKARVLAVNYENENGKTRTH